MDYIAWINRLKTWGVPNINAASKTTLVFFIVWTLVKWFLIALGIFAGVIYYILFAVIIGFLKGK
jgi:hypothetical protein